jgi:hypothetical protein
LKSYFLTFIKPGQSLRRLLDNERSFQLGFLYILIPIVGYTLMYVFLTIGKGAPSVLTPWLNIPEEDYYAVNRFLLAPGMILSWIAATSVTQILSKLFKGTGTFEQTLSLLALSISVAMWGGLIHDLPMSFLSAVGVIDAREHEIAMNSPTIFRTILWCCYSVYFLLFLILFPLTVKVVHGLNAAKSILIGILAFIIFQVLFLLFNR